MIIVLSDNDDDQELRWEDQFSISILFSSVFNYNSNVCVDRNNEKRELNQRTEERDEDGKDPSDVSPEIWWLWWWDEGRTDVRKNSNDETLFFLFSSLSSMMYFSTTGEVELSDEKTDSSYSQQFSSLVFFYSRFVLRIFFSFLLQVYCSSDVCWNSKMMEAKKFLRKYEEDED